MSIKLTQLVWNTEINLMPSEKFVLIFLATCANDKNNYLCCPSINTITKRCNLSRSHVKRILHNLCALDLIKKIPQKLEGNNFNSNHYVINESILAEGGRSTHEPTPRSTHEPRVGPPTNPNNISNNETIKKENYIKEKTETSALQQHSSSVLRSTAKLVIDFLNTKAKKNFRYTETSIKLIVALLKEGVTIEQFKQVIVRQQREWGNNKEMQKYVRPITLFRKSNFYDKYLPECITKEEQEKII